MINNLNIKLNQEYKVKCISINNYAKGVAKIDSFLVFVDNLYPSEEALIKITELHKNYAFGEVIKYLSLNPNRIDDECNHSHSSGSCPFNNITLEYENELKSEMVRLNVERALNKKIDKIDVLYAEPLKGYRNKVTAFYDQDYDFGYFREGTHNIEKLNSCIQISSEILKVLNDLSLILKKNKTPIFNYKTNTGLFKGASIRRSTYNNLMSVMFLVTKDDETFKDISYGLKELNDDISSVSLSIDKGDNTHVYSDNEKVIFGNPSITEKILDNLFIISNNSFLQVNTKGAELLYSEAIKMAELKKSDTVLDLYSGAGGISLSLAKNVKEVIGIEVVESAVKSAECNKELNSINNVYFYNDDASNFKNILGSKRIDILFVDPPRSGLKLDVISNIISLSPNKIIYVSCDSYTMARDIKLLSMSGFELKDIKCVNMFLRTKHVETVCLLTLKNQK